ncbi:MAG: hypothetical protein ABWZ15_06070 [Acidimicrobiia bacterium]
MIDRGDGRALDWETRPDDILEFGTSPKFIDTIARTDETRNLVRSHWNGLVSARLPAAICARRSGRTCRLRLRTRRCRAVRARSRRSAVERRVQ